MSVSFRKVNEVGYIEFDHPDSKVNILTADVIQRLDAVIDEVARQENLKVVLLVSKKKDIFIAGADIKEIENIADPSEAIAKANAGQNVFNKLEDLNVPTVAVIDGAALGGGCELALACRYRVATFNDKVRIGLPEVNLGILPGFGGTYRLPRALGLERAVRMITTCKIVSGPEALKIGLVDAVFPQQSLDQELQRWLQQLPVPATERKRKKTPVQTFLEGNFLGRMFLFQETRKAIRAITKGFYPAPLKAAEVLEQAFGQPRHEALQIEARGFSELVVTEVCKNLIRVFYLSEKFKKFSVPGAEQVPPAKIEKIAVLGAGVMGGGIAQLFSQQGMTVRLKDINFDAIGKGFKAAQKVYDQLVQKKKLSTAEANLRMSRMTGTLDYSGFQNAELVVEAVVENLEIKKKVFQELSSVSNPEAILATNTSALSVTEMSAVTKDPSKVIGIHFFNPVHRMPLIEIVKTPQTSLATLAAVVQLTKALGKTPIIVKDSCGFLVNRVLLGYINEAGRLLEEGAKVEEVDRAATDFGLPMGPFALTDEVGVDVGIKVLHVLEKGLGKRFQPVEAFEKVFQAGLLGKKSGSGFYVHRKFRSLNPRIAQLVHVRERRKFVAKEALERMLLVMINEASRCLEEGVVDGPDVVDIGMIMGTGFPPFRGGLLRYADSLTVGYIVERLTAFERITQSDRFHPSAYLINLKNQNRSFFNQT